MQQSKGALTPGASRVQTGCTACAHLAMDLNAGLSIIRPALLASFSTGSITHAPVLHVITCKMQWSHSGTQRKRSGVITSLFLPACSTTGREEFTIPGGASDRLLVFCFFLLLLFLHSSKSSVRSTAGGTSHPLVTDTQPACSIQKY